VAEKWKSKASTSALQQSDTLKAAKNIFATRSLRSSPKEPANNFLESTVCSSSLCRTENLPVYTFMVDLICYQAVSDPDKDMSSLTVCWLGDDIETGLPELIDREISSVEWDEYAVNGSF
jgi:hypothetical protein